LVHVSLTLKLRNPIVIKKFSVARWKAAVSVSGFHCYRSGQVFIVELQIFRPAARATGMRSQGTARPGWRCQPRVPE
jgi:hypothetical protein